MIYETDNYKAIDSKISVEALQIFILQDNKKINCLHYYEKNRFSSKFSKKNGLSFMHLNNRSLSKHFDNLNLLSTLGHRFRIIGLSETRLSHKSFVPHNLELDSYSLKFIIKQRLQREALLFTYVTSFALSCTMIFRLLYTKRNNLIQPY